MNPQKMTMIVARYKENLNWLKNVRWNYIVYNAGKDALPAWIKNEIKLPNTTGNEAYAYLTYIIDNYDNLPDFVICVQGHPFDHLRDLIKTISNFDGKADFFPLSDSVYLDKYENRKVGIELAESIRKLFLDDLKSFKYFEYPEGSQFIASKKAILFHTKRTYRRIRDFPIEEEQLNKKSPGYRIFSAKFPRGGTRLFHTKITLRKMIDSMTDEKHLIDRDIRILSYWVMEVLWKTLFDRRHKTVYD